MQSQIRVRAAALSGMLLLMMSFGAALPVQGAGAAQPRGQLSTPDYDFASDAARGGMAEVQMGQLAEQKGAGTVVRNFGQRMVTDHSQADNQLKQVLAQKGAALPSSLSPADSSTLGRLQSLSGVSFDKAYARDMVKDHEKDIQDFEKTTQQLTDPQLKAWAEKTLPMLREHLALAREMQTAVSHE